MCSLGKRLQEIRHSLRLTQAQMAEKGGVKTRAQIYYEADERCPDGHYFEAIAKVGADVQYIITGIRSQSVASPSGEYRVLTKKQETLLNNLEHCPEDVQDAISRLALQCKRHDRDENDQIPKSA